MTQRGRIAVSLAACLFSLLAVLSGVDRDSSAWPNAAAALPEWAKANAWHDDASRALTSGDSEPAQRYAAKGIAADPADPRGPSLLAAAQLAALDFEAADKSFAIADRTGLRTPLVQAYYFDRALAEGDGAEAARRLDILLLAHPSLAQTDFFFRAMEQSEVGSRELARRVASEPAWASAYLTGFGSQDSVLLDRAAYLATSEAFNLGCDRIEPMLRALADRGHRAQAQSLAARQCPSRAASQAIVDTGFEQFGEDGALGWQRHPSGDVRMTLIGRSDKQLEIVNRSGSTRLVLSQSVALAPGEYRIFASISQDRSDAVVATLDCGAPQRPSRGSGSLAAGQLLQGQECADQQLGIWLRPRSGVVRLDNMRVEPVGVQDPAPPSISAP